MSKWYEKLNKNIGIDFCRYQAWYGKYATAQPLAIPSWGACFIRTGSHGWCDVSVQVTKSMCDLRASSTHIQIAMFWRRCAWRLALSCLKAMLSAWPGGVATPLPQWGQIPAKSWQTFRSNIPPNNSGQIWIVQKNHNKTSPKACWQNDHHFQVG